MPILQAFCGVFHPSLMYHSFTENLNVTFTRSTRMLLVKGVPPKMKVEPIGDGSIGSTESSAPRGIWICSVFPGFVLEAMHHQTDMSGCCDLPINPRERFPCLCKH